MKEREKSQLEALDRLATITVWSLLVVANIALSVFALSFIDLSLFLEIPLFILVFLILTIIDFAAFT